MPDTDMMDVGGRQKVATSEIESRKQSETVQVPASTAAEQSKSAPKGAPVVRRRRILPLVITATVVVIAAALTVAMWDAYMGAPWTRDSTVRAYVIKMAPEVSGRIVALPVADNQFVHKGDLLMVIDPTNYRIAVSLDEAAAQQAQVNMQNTDREAKRRLQLSDIAVTVEQRQTFQTQAVAAKAQYQQALANLDQARVNLERTEIHSPVNGWVTNLLAQRGDYATAGQNLISLTDANSFWVDAYFEETNVSQIKVGDRADIKLMGYNAVVRGHVDSIARAISVANAQPNELGVATVNPIFTWVRLAQRIPVRIHIDEVPAGIALVAGMTATVQIDGAPR